MADTSIAFPSATPEQRAMLDDVERAVDLRVDSAIDDLVIPDLTTISTPGSSSAVAEPWFEWNGTDLTQFGSRVDGASVNAASSVSLTTYAGVSWIQLHLQFDVGTVSNQAQNFYLPINTTPPSANYSIEADFIVTAESTAFNLCGFFLAVRYVSTTQGYLFHHYGRQAFNNLAFDSPGRLTSPESGNFTGLGFKALLTSNENAQIAATNQGFTSMRLGAQGTTTESLISYGASVGGYHGVDTSPFTSVGQAAIGMSGLNDSTASTKTALVRNIRCYELS